MDKIAIGHRLLRAKTEGPAADDGYRVSPAFGRVHVHLRAREAPLGGLGGDLPDNIEGEALEDKLMGMLTTQLGLDVEDLHWNGDTATDPVDPDHDFLSLNDGWWKQLIAGGTCQRCRAGRRWCRHLQESLLRRLQGASGASTCARTGGAGP